MDVKRIVLFYCVLIRRIESKSDSPFSRSFDDSSQKNYPDPIGNYRLTTPEIILRYKYPVETHYVTTADGYIIGMHRLPKEGGQPYLLQHGLFDSSATWVLQGSKTSLAFLLHDLGYDVWLGNLRGNRYSRNHTTLDPDEPDFWNFSFHEIGLNDLPAMVDYVLAKSCRRKLFYIGHSQGTTIFFVLTSRKPEYNEKFALMHAFSPVAYMNNIKCILVPLANALCFSPMSAMFSELLPRGMIFNLICFVSPQTRDMCLFYFYLIFGTSQQMNTTLYQMILSHAPAGASINQVRHYLQLISSAKFREYDYGTVVNLRHYGQAEPPDYDLSKVTAPVALHYSTNDLLSDPVDVDRLYSEISRPVGKYQVPFAEFNHMDFVWGTDVRTLLYNLVVSLTRQFQTEDYNTIY